MSLFIEVPVSSQEIERSCMYLCVSSADLTYVSTLFWWCCIFSQYIYMLI